MLGFWKTVCVILLLVCTPAVALGDDETPIGWWKVVAAQEYGKEIAEIRGAYVLITTKCVVIVRSAMKQPGLLDDFGGEKEVLDADAWSYEFKTAKQIGRQIVALTEAGPAIIVDGSEVNSRKATMKIVVRSSSEDLRESKPELKLERVTQLEAKKYVKPILGAGRYRLTTTSYECVENQLQD